jgi:hypothetical protein
MIPRFEKQTDDLALMNQKVHPVRGVFSFTADAPDGASDVSRGFLTLITEHAHSRSPHDDLLSEA